MGSAVPDADLLRCHAQGAGGEDDLARVNPAGLVEAAVGLPVFDRRRGVVNYLLDLIPGVDMNQFNWIGGEPFVFFIVVMFIKPEGLLARRR